MVQLPSSPISLSRLRSALPSAITVFAILAGYVSILESFHGNYLAAAGLILLAAVLDMLDGRVARAMNTTSDFGVEFDSLADVVNYGVAPAVLFYQLYFHTWGIIGTILSFLPICCAAIRLARFNIAADPDIPTKYFIGLPTTIAAVVMAGYVIFIHTMPHSNAAAHAAIVTIFTAFLMVSEVQYEKSNILSLRYIRKTRRIITGTLILVSMALFPGIAFFAWGLLYIMYGAARSAIYTIWYGGDDVSEIDIDNAYQ